MTTAVLEPADFSLEPQSRKCRTRKPKTMSGSSPKRAEEGGDDFQTPPIALTVLYPYLPAGSVIWEPAMGNGNLVIALMKRGHPVIGSDIKAGQNFFSYRPEGHWDIHVTNPPYSIQDKWLAECYRWYEQHGKPFALLLSQVAFGAQERQKMYRKYGVEVVSLGRRISFTTPSGTGGGSYFDTFWFTKGLNIGSALTWAEMDTENQCVEGQGALALSEER